MDLAEQMQSGAVPPPDFALWPESSTAVDPFRDVATNSGISRAVAAIGVPVRVAPSSTALARTP